VVLSKTASVKPRRSVEGVTETARNVDAKCVVPFTAFVVPVVAVVVPVVAVMVAKCAPSVVTPTSELSVVKSIITTKLAGILPHRAKASV